MGKKNKNKNDNQAASGSSESQPPTQTQPQQSQGQPRQEQQNPQGQQRQGQQQAGQQGQPQQSGKKQRQQGHQQQQNPQQSSGRQQGQQQPQGQQQQQQPPRGQQQQQQPPQGQQQQQQRPQVQQQQQQRPQGQQQQQQPPQGQQQQQQPQGQQQQKQRPQQQKKQQRPQGQQQQQPPQGQQQQQQQPPQGQQQQQQPPQGQQQQQQPQGQQQQKQRPQQQKKQQRPQGQQQQQPPQGQQQQQQQPPQGQQQQQQPPQGQQQQQRPQAQQQQQQRPPGQQQQASEWRQQPQQQQPPQGQQQQQQRPQAQQQQQQAQQSRGRQHGQQQQLEGTAVRGWGRGRGQIMPGQQQSASGPNASVQQQGTWGPSPYAQQQLQQQGTWGPGPSAQQHVQQQGTWGPGPSAQQQAQQQGTWSPGPSGQQQYQQQSARGPPGAQSRDMSSSSSGSVQPKAGRPTSVQQAAHGKSETPSPQYTPRQTSVSKSSSSTSFSSNVSQRSIPPGTLGIPGDCEANYLVLNLDRMPDVAYHYDVTITPDRPKKFFRKAFKQFVNTYLSGCTIAFDGVKSCYMVQKLPNPVYEGDVKIPDSGSREIQFRVCIKPTDNAEVELRSLKTYHNERVYDKPMRALQCVEVVLANACHDKGIRVGRSFFTPPDRTIDLDEGFELYTGLYQAAILGDAPYLNVDVSHKSFPMPYKLTDYLQKVWNARLESGLDPRTHQNISKHLRGLNIKYTPPPSFGSIPRSYKVNEVSNESASILSFTDDKGNKLTVQRYFASKGYNIRYPNLNCIIAGSAVKPNYLPIELCHIEPGQAIKRKDGSKQVQKMIRYAATSTDERKRKIMEKLQYFMHNADELVRGFGINIGNGFITVPTRLLKPPSIEYRNRCVEPRNGSWRNVEFLTTGATRDKEGHKWAIIYAPSKFLRYPNLQDLSNMLFNGAQRMGINLSRQREIQETRDIVKTLEDYKRKGYDLVIVVIPNFGTSYADIKQKAELVCGLLTQCIKETTVNRRVDEQLVGNLLLKVNSKLNGSNHKIANRSNIQLDNVMFMGADVTHPSPDQRHIPSVVGVAASHDLNGASYNMQYRLQESTKEEIDDMQSICRQHLKVYFQKQNCYPKSIIYYRDGVSDGQFQKVEHLELGAIRAVCKELRISPKITCVIVVKRHHTRFFPTKPTGDKFNNVLPGTVVDQKIVHPNETQFFMVSHQSIQGTAKPTRYNVIVDDAKMTMDELQKLTNNLCYMFPRCNRAVSYPAPAYLAHLVAARGRVYIEGPPLRRGLREEYNRRIINEQFMKTTPMFFV